MVYYKIQVYNDDDVLRYKSTKKRSILIGRLANSLMKYPSGGVSDFLCK